MLPDVLLAGLPKCGTTALYHWFDRRADVFVPTVKEPHTLSDLAVSGVSDFESYEALFRGAAGHRRVDCSTSSVLHADRVIANADRHEVPIDVVLIVYRHPVERCISHWNYARKIGQEDRTLDAVSAADWATPDDPWHVPSAYLEPGLLAPGLAALIERFPTVRVLPYSAMRADPDAFLAEVCRALGIAVVGDGPRLEERNVSLRPRGPVGKTVLAVANRFGASGVAWPRLFRSLARRLFIAGSSDLARDVSEAVDDELKRYYVDDQAALRRLMNAHPDVFPIALDGEWVG